MPRKRTKHLMPKKKSSIPRISRVRVSRVRRNGGVRMVARGSYSAQPQAQAMKPRGPDVAAMNSSIEKGPLLPSSPPPLMRSTFSTGPLIEEGSNPLVDR